MICIATPHPSLFSTPLFHPPPPFYYAPFYPPTTSRNTTPLISPNRSPSGGGANSNLSDTDKRALCVTRCAWCQLFILPSNFQIFEQVRSLERTFSLVARVTPSGGRRNAIHGVEGGVNWGKQICLSLVTTEMYSRRGQPLVKALVSSFHPTLFSRREGAGLKLWGKGSEIVLFAVQSQ